MSKSTITTRDEIKDLIRARYSIIYCVSSEEERVENELTQIAGELKNRKLFRWSVTEGFHSPSHNESYVDIKDPLRGLEFISNYEDHAIFVLRDFHPFLNNPQVARRIRDLSHQFKHDPKYLKMLVILAPLYKSPPELEKEMSVLDYELPTRDEIDLIINKCLRGIKSTAKLRAREDATHREHVIEAALGLTAVEAENVFAKSLVRMKDLDIETILSEKKHIIRKSGILEFFEASEEFSDIGGLDILKDWLRKRQLAFSKEAREFGLPIPKGILLLGIPGCGKSLTAKAIGALWKMPLLRLDVGKVFAGLVGSSEENMRRAIKTAEAVAPAILWLDELEKGFSGTKSSGQTDSGTAARVFGSFITWLQEKESPVFVVATANDVSMLPPELLRKGRFDEIFFVDLPTNDEREEIFTIHIEKKKRDPKAFDIKKLVAASQGFSGSEIEQAIVSGLYDAFYAAREIDTETIVNSAQEIIPLSYTMKERIDWMREWSKSRARIASPKTSSGESASDAAVRQLEL
ncbi:MAG: AAA family ATPase [Myxococcales bacterium]|nr:AAA family ATPase [Myxococcales bacterium]